MGALLAASFAFFLSSFSFSFLSFSFRAALTWDEEDDDEDDGVGGLPPPPPPGTAVIVIGLTREEGAGGVVGFGTTGPVLADEPPYGVTDGRQYSGTAPMFTLGISRRMS